MKLRDLLNQEEDEKKDTLDVDEIVGDDDDDDGDGDDGDDD